MIGIGEAEVLSERLKRELHALEAANVHAILESEPLVTEVISHNTGQVVKIYKSWNGYRFLLWILRLLTRYDSCSMITI